MLSDFNINVVCKKIDILHFRNQSTTQKKIHTNLYVDMHQKLRPYPVTSLILHIKQNYSPYPVF